MKRPLPKGRLGFTTLSTALLTALAISVTGCDNGGNAPDTTNNNNSAPTQPANGGDNAGQTPEETPADTPSETPAPQADPEPAAETPAETNGELVEVELELPAPLFLGTPKEPPTGTTALGNLPPREPLKAPAGAVNLAKGKPVTSSDDMPIIGDLDQVTDGDKEATDGSYVELGSGKQWVVIDLEEPGEIYGIVIWHFHADPRIYRDVVVEIADDESFTKNVRTVFNNDQDNSLGQGVGEEREYFENNEGHLIYVKGEKARYVRLWSQGNTADDQNHYIEVEVWGVPAK